MTPEATQIAGTGEFLNYVAAAIAVFAAGYGVGTFFTHRKKIEDADTLFASRLKELFGTVRIVSMTVEPTTAARGHDLTMRLTISSSATYA